jgi:hypothetical protein
MAVKVDRPQETLQLLHKLGLREIEDRLDMAA